MARKPMPHVIVLLPGIMGSVLKKDGKDAWALSAGGIFNALFSLGSSVNDLELQTDSPDKESLGDGVIVDGLMSDAHLIPGLWKIDGYTTTVREIEARFDVERGKNFFEFPYDWRRDNRAAAHRLQRMSKEWLKAWREESGNNNAKLFLIGHSMGGLVSRYFLEVLEGWKDTRALITFGTPYRGASKAFDFVTNGLQKSLGPISILDLTKLLRSFTSIYQLLPTSDCYDPGNGKHISLDNDDFLEGRIRIPNVDVKKVKAGLDFHKEINDAVAKNRLNSEYHDKGYKLYPIVGIKQPTLQSGKFNGTKAEFVNVSFDGTDYMGDGTVPQFSATPRDFEDGTRAIFAAESHGSLQNSPAVLVNLEGILSTPDFSKFRGELPIDAIQLGLAIDDSYTTEEPITVRVSTDLNFGIPLTATVFDISNGAEIRNAELNRKKIDNWQMVEMSPLPKGTYRICISGNEDVSPVTDIFSVF